MNFAVFGAGAWGTAVAILLAKGGNTVALVPRREEHAQALQDKKENTDYLPGCPLPENIQITCAPDLSQVDVVVFGCPSKVLKETAQKVKALFGEKEALLYISLCKGVEKESGRPPHEVLEDVFPGKQCASLSGPTNAMEVAKGNPAAVVLAAGKVSPELKKAQEAINNKAFRVYSSDDLLGVELGGCLKNIYAISAGICDGLKLGDNAKASLLTRSLHEMVRLGVSSGGRQETFYGLSGFGDLVATSFGSWSRNRTFGQHIGEGKTIEELMKGRKTVVEGYSSVDVFRRKAQEKRWEMPILEELYQVLYVGKAPKEGLLSLMSRDLKAEAKI